jgi:hypothetical protein
VRNLAPIILCLLLVACQVDPNAGMVAARRMGQSHYLSIPKDGKLMSAAVFKHRGVTHLYLPWIDSRPIPGIDPLSIFPGSTVEPVRPYPKTALLTYGCLPQAIIEVRHKGGRVIHSGTHAYRVP